MDLCSRYVGTKVLRECVLEGIEICIHAMIAVIVGWQLACVQDAAFLLLVALVMQSQCGNMYHRWHDVLPV
jgi:hypothetical protein